MKTKIEVELVPFKVPNYVLHQTKIGARQEGMQDKSKSHLSELDESTLARLCYEFKREVFEKAGKDMPPEPGDTY